MKTDLQAAHKLLEGALQQHKFDNAVGFIHSYDIHKTNKVIAELLARIEELEKNKNELDIIKSEGGYEDAMLFIKSLMDLELDENGIKTLEAIAVLIEKFEAENIGGES